jgi:putative exporter of polyketide antibiotics
MSRRVMFFAGAALLCAFLVPVAPVELRWVPIGVSAVYFVLAALTGLEDWLESRRDRAREP